MALTRLYAMQNLENTLPTDLFLGIIGRVINSTQMSISFVQNISAVQAAALVRDVYLL